MYPGDEDIQCVEFILQCGHCAAEYTFEAHFTAAGTRFYWSDWQETNQEGTA
jgi:hypothetical protein